MDKKESMLKQRNIIDGVINFMRDEGILSHLRYKRLKNDTRHWYLTKAGVLEEHRKRKNRLQNLNIPEVVL